MNTFITCFIRQLFVAIVLLSPVWAQAQSVNWSEHIAPIIYKHCTTCHRPGEIAPFSLTNYQEAVSWGNMIQYATEIRYMPPWKADTDYGRDYLGENTLSEAEINAIKDWVNGGMPRGNAALEPPTPVFPSGSQVGEPDLVVSFAKTHMHPGNDKDEYRFFVIPTGLTQGKDLVGLEMRPGNKKVVHHALVWADSTGSAARLDAQTPEYGYKGNEVSGSGQLNFGEQLPSYVPGAYPHLFNHEMAQRLPAKSDLVVQVHYAPTSTDEPDSSTFNLFFADRPAKRYVRSQILLPFNLVNGPFVIQPNTVKEFHAVFKIPLIDVSLLGVAPHCHLLGKNWRVFAVTPTKDTIPIVQVKEWDFNWQGAYMFTSPLKLPRNTEIHAYCTYDNTTNNLFNPFNPPVTARWGEGTSDEMFYLPLLWVPYQKGDENLKMGSDVSTPTHDFHFMQTKLYPVAPNPATAEVKIGFTLHEVQPVTLELRSLDGQLLKTLVNSARHLAGEHILNWDSRSLPNGVYLLSLHTSQGVQTQRLLVSR